MRNPDDKVREQVLQVLDWEDAHVSFDQAVAGLRPASRAARPPGFDHSVWELVEHIRLAQDDIVDFCVNAHYAHDLNFPDDYWPKEAAPADESAWTESLVACERGRERLKQVARDVEDLAARVPTGTGTQTYLRAILLAADHTAYHVGQIVAVRRALDDWR